MKKIFTLLFFALLGLNNINAATFSSVASGTWSAPATWTLTAGTDADGIPDSDDDVTIVTGHTITLTSTAGAKTLLTQINSILNGNSRTLVVRGNWTNSGNVTGPLTVSFEAACTFSSSTTYTASGDWFIQNGGLTIAPGTTIFKGSFFAIRNGLTLTNFGNTTVSGLNLYTSGTYINAANSSTTVYYDIRGTGTLSLTTAPNNFTYNNGTVYTIYPTTYYNLTINAASTKSLSANTTVLNDFAMGTGGNNFLNMNNFNLNVGGNWTNNSTTTITNQGIITFNGTANQLVSAAKSSEIFDKLTIAPSSSITLNKSITVNQNLDIGTNSILDVSASNYSVTLRGNLVNNGSINPRQNLFTFNGTGAQTISGTGATSLYNVLISNNSVSGVTLGQPITASRNFSVSTGSTFNVSSSNYSVNIGGNLLNNGAINTQQGLITLNGSTAQTISGSTNTQFYNLTLNNALGLTISSAQSLKNILTVTTGNFNSNGNFTLLSDGTSTGIIGSSSGTFSGSMTIQKHISARVANYHDLSSPVSNTTIMDWDDDLYMSGIGAYDGVVGPAGVDGTSGADSTVYYWNEPTGSYRAVTGSTTPLVVGRGYEIYIGDDTISWVARTIDTKGTPNFGTRTLNLSYTAGTYAGLNLVGNPYAASINYSACPKTNVTSILYILDDSGNYNDYGPNAVIPPLQGFWIEASGSGATLTFTETCKSTSTATNFYRTKPNYGIKLVFSCPSLPFYNENTINFESESTLGYDRGLDALYLKSPNKNAPAIYMLTDTDAKLITNNIDSQKDEVTIPLAIFTPKDGVYYIEPTVLNTDNYRYAWIENTKTGEKFDLNSSITIVGEENKTNNNFTLRLSKNSKQSEVSENVFDNDIIVFATENDVNLKSVNTSHIIDEVSIYDVSGKLLISQRNLTLELGQTNKVDISNLAHGFYIVNLIDILGHTKTQKIVH